MNIPNHTKPGPNDADRERDFPIQSSGYGVRYSIPWHMAEKAYETYYAHYKGQTLERVAERGGFGLDEWACLYLGHEAEESHLKRDGSCVAKAIVAELAAVRVEVRKEYGGLSAGTRDAAMILHLAVNLLNKGYPQAAKALLKDLKPEWLSDLHEREEARMKPLVEALQGCPRGAEEMREAIREILREHAKRLSRPILCEKVEEQMDGLEPKKEKV